MNYGWEFPYIGGGGGPEALNEKINVVCQILWLCPPWVKYITGQFCTAVFFFFFFLKKKNNSQLMGFWGLANRNRAST
jgi:hypothetical protein